MKKIVIFIILLFLLTPVAVADPFSDFVRNVFAGNTITGKVTSETPLILHRTVRKCSNGRVVGEEQVIDLRTFRGGTYTNYACESQYKTQCSTNDPDDTYYDEWCEYDKTAVVEETTETIGECTDSDGGKNYYEKGNVQGVFREEGREGKAEDYCIINMNSDNPSLVEFYCNDEGKVDAMPTYDCTSEGKICQNGACVNGASTGEKDEYFLQTGYSINVGGYDVELYNVYPNYVKVKIGNQIVTINSGETITFGNLRIAIDEIFYSSHWAGDSSATLKIVPVLDVEVPFEERDLIALGNSISSKGNDEFSDGLGHLMISKESPTIETSLTSSEDDYQTDVVMEVARDSLRYSLINPGNLIRSSTKPIDLTILGREMKITEVKTDTSFVIDDKIVRDGDAFVGEDPNNPNWVWDLNNLMGDNPIVGVENDFIYNDDSDNPPKVGECIYLPFNYAKICLDSLNVKDNEYDTLVIERTTTNLLSSFGIGSNTPIIELSSPTRNVIKDLDSNKIFVTSDGKVYYEQRGQASYLKEFPLAGEIGKINSDLSLGLFTDNYDNSILVFLDELNISEKESNLVALFGISEGGITSLGRGLSESEPGELYYLKQGLGSTNSMNIGTKDEDHRTAYGIIIRDPKAHSASEEVFLEIPKKQVKAKVSVKFTDGENITEGKVILKDVGANAVLVEVDGVQETISVGETMVVNGMVVGVLDVKGDKATLLVSDQMQTLSEGSIHEFGNVAVGVVNVGTNSVIVSVGEPKIYQENEKISPWYCFGLFC